MMGLSYIGAAVAAVVFLLGLAVLLRWVWGNRGNLKGAGSETASLRAGEPEKSESPLPLTVALPPSEREQQKQQEALTARRAAEAAAEARAKAKLDAHAAADAQARALLEAKAQEAKAVEEEAKKEAYRAEKAAEAEEKERKRREREEAQRLAEVAAEQARREEVEAAAAKAEEEKRRIEAEAGQTLSQGLSKTRKEGFIARLNGLFGGGPAIIDDRILGELEEILFTADIGVKTATRLLETARDQAKKKEVGDVGALKALIRKEVESIVSLPSPRQGVVDGLPQVVMVVGVNGAGKTTTLGKLAAQYKASGKKVLVIAGDTFRAAATEQLDVWAGRAGVSFFQGKEGADPASVVFDGIKRGLEDKADVILADTAGRLHTQAPLMEELKKVRRVMGKAMEGAPHEVLLVMDATNGQNGIAQARQFHEAVGVSAIALTKLDGTAKGGVIIGICDELKVPVAWVGVGEKVSDLKPFVAREFVAALFDD